MGDLTGSEVKVLLYVLRRTVGYGEDVPRVITYAEFQSGRKRADGTILEGGTGVSRAALLNTVKGLVAKGLLSQEPVELAPGYYVNRYVLCALGGSYAAPTSLRITLEAFRRHLEQRRPFLKEAPLVKYGWRGWKALREIIFEVDSFACQYCGSAGGHLVVDHIIPRSSGGSDEPTNLVTACLECNSSKANRTPEEWLGKLPDAKGGK
jgi:hypothetical protein